MDTLLQDLRYGFRLLRRNLRFTIAAVAALGLGIGVNTAVFTAYEAFVLRQLDARNPDEMVNLAVSRPRGATQYTFSNPDYEAYRDSMRSVSGLIAFYLDRLPLASTGGAAGQRSPAAGAEVTVTFVVSENYFPVLGVGAIRGRTFDAIGVQGLLESPSVLISENYWQKRFAGDPAVLGQTVYLGGTPFAIAGITPRDFTGTGVMVPDVWLPMSLVPLIHGDENWLRDRENERFRLFARRAPGVDAEQVQAEMGVIAERLRAQHDPSSVSASPGTAIVWPGSPTPRPLRSVPALILAAVLIMAAAGMVLLVACANVASLQLARARSRVNELRTRLSVGATRTRVIRQLLTESALLGAIAGIVALFVTWVLLRIAITVAAGFMPPGNGSLVFDVAPNLTIFAYVSAISLTAGLLFGLVPAIESSRGALADSVRASTAPARSRRVQGALIAAQVSLSLVLLIVGAMMIRGSINAVSTDPGYDTTRVAMIEMRFPNTARYTTDRREALIAELRSRLASLPGVESITEANAPVLEGRRTAALPVNGSTPTQSVLRYRYVEANYFDTVGIPFTLGRSFASGGGEPEQAIVLSESAAQELWPGRNPVGQSVRLGTTRERALTELEFSQAATEFIANGPVYQVVGVVRDVRGIEYDGSGTKHIYLPRSSSRFAGYPLLVRTRSDASSIVGASGRLLAEIDPDVPGNVVTLETMRRQAAPFIASAMSALVASIVGFFGLLLASMGIHGTVSYVVLHRTREIGIRMALGAEARQVLGMILRDSTRPVMAGVMTGLVLAVGASYLVRNILYGLGTIDGISFAGVSALLLAVALLAAWAPARRASRIDPNVALRYE